MNSAPVASGIGVFSGEVEGVVCRECHFGARVEGSGGNVAVDADGEVTCVTIVSGHPLIIGTAIDSVRRWKFRSYVVNGLRKAFCGKVTLRYNATDSEVKYEVIQATSN